MSVECISFFFWSVLLTDENGPQSNQATRQPSDDMQQISNSLQHTRPEKSGCFHSFCWPPSGCESIVVSCGCALRVRMNNRSPDILTENDCTMLLHRSTKHETWDFCLSTLHSCRFTFLIARVIFSIFVFGIVVICHCHYDSSKRMAGKKKKSQIMPEVCAIRCEKQSCKRTVRSREPLKQKAKLRLPMAAIITW